MGNCNRSRPWLLASAVVGVATAVGFAVLRTPSIRLTGHERGVAAVVVSPDGKTLYSGSSDTTIRFWDMRTGKCLAVLDPPEGRFPGSGKGKGTYYDYRSRNPSMFIDAMGITPDGKTLVVGTSDRALCFWDVATRRRTRVVVLPFARPGTKSGNAIRGLAVSPDGKLVATATEDHLVRLWSMATGKEERVLRGHSHFVLAVAFAPDSKTLASGSIDKTVRLWDVATGKQIRVLEGHTEKVRAVAFSPDGKLLASGGGEVQTIPEATELKLWDASTGKELAALDGHSAPVFCVAFSPDGKLLASGGGDAYQDLGELILWDVAKRKKARRLGGHANIVHSIAFAPDGKRLVSGSGDKTIRIWDIVAAE